MQMRHRGEREKERERDKYVFFHSSLTEEDDSFGCDALELEGKRFGRGSF